MLSNVIRKKIISFDSMKNKSREMLFLRGVMMNLNYKTNRQIRDLSQKLIEKGVDGKEVRKYLVTKNQHL